jgi:hypothetical protein
MHRILFKTMIVFLSPLILYAEDSGAPSADYPITVRPAAKPKADPASPPSDKPLIPATRPGVQLPISHSTVTTYAGAGGIKRTAETSKNLAPIAQQSTPLSIKPLTARKIGPEQAKIIEGKPELIRGPGSRNLLESSDSPKTES